MYSLRNAKLCMLVYKKKIFSALKFEKLTFPSLNILGILNETTRK